MKKKYYRPINHHNFKFITLYSIILILILILVSDFLNFFFSFYILKSYLINFTIQLHNSPNISFIYLFLSLSYSHCHWQHLSLSLSLQIYLSLSVGFSESGQSSELIQWRWPDLLVLWWLALIWWFDEEREARDIEERMR